MAASSSSPPPLQRSKRKNGRRNRVTEGARSEGIDRLNALPWKQAVSNEDESFAPLLVGGSSELEGGFFSLEELDESEYGVVIPEPSLLAAESKKKRKRQESDGEFLVDASEDGSEEKVESSNNNDNNNKRKKKKKKEKKKEKKENGRIPAVGPANSSASGVSEQEDVANTDEDTEQVAEFHAWNELRLHHLLMKSIYKIGFKEPTPIQKACVPAAAHLGKDVIGAAETGSGKTLAFGLPILQRLLEEREKAAKSLVDKGNLVEKDARGGPLRALIVTPTRELALQVSDHLKSVARFTNIRAVPIVGGMSTEKQERLLKARPEIIVGTPGRLWELMSGGECHLVELHSLSFFVLDEADRMIENGHFHELQSIIDMLPTTGGSVESHPQTTENCVTVSNLQRKKRQTFVFSATISLSADFRKKLKRGSLKSKLSMSNGVNSLETLSERAGMRADAAIFDLTNASILADKLEESFIECREEDKDAYLYYLLSVHGQGRTIVFCTSIAALRHISSLLRILGVNVWTLHAQMQQRARLKAIDRFRENEHGTLIATDVAARGLDIPGVRTVVHYQLPHSADVYVHRSGRTARASADGCCIALISPNDRTKFASLCKSFSKESLRRFPVDDSYMSGVIKRLSLARQIDKIARKDSQEKAKKNWFERNAESVELLIDHDDSEEERANSYRQKKKCSLQLKKLQQELNSLLSRPLQPDRFSHRYLAGTGVSPTLQRQFEELVKQKKEETSSRDGKRRKIVVIGQDCIEPLEALRGAGHEVLNLKEMAEKQRNADSFRRKKKEEKKRLHEKRRKERKKLKNNIE